MTLQLRVHIVDTRGYVVRDALVFARSTPLVTSAAGEPRTATDGWATLRMVPKAGFPIRTGHNVQFFIRVRKPGDNLLAGVSTILAGRFDDRFGARAVIIFSLSGLVVAGLAVFFLHDAGKLVFWIFGLVLTLFVGPAQAASRSFLARVTPAGRESEIFGLYATTGRAASFLSPLLWAGLIAAFGATYWGILGIVIVLAAGLVLMLFVKAPAEQS